MTQDRGKSRRSCVRVSTALVLMASVAGAACNRSGRPAAVGNATLRVGVNLPTGNPLIGLRQLTQNLTQDNLVRVGDDARVQPWLVESWKVGNDGRSVALKLRPNVTFHDGSAVDAAAVVKILPDSLRGTMGPMFSEIDRIAATGKDSLEIAFKRQSSFLLEVLEAPIGKPAEIGTGPFVIASPTELRANANYYLGRPGIDRVTMTTYPNVRAAWADLLRNRIDMLYEVGSDALQSLEGSSNIKTFTFVRRYQYVIAFNSRSPKFKSPAVRRALNEAVDRAAVIKDGLSGHGVAASSLLWPQHWAFRSDVPQFQYDPIRAAAELKSAQPGLTFTCYVRPEATDERLALTVRRQLNDVGVTMNVEQAPQERVFQALTAGDYDAVLLAATSAPTIFRMYFTWHTHGALNVGRFGNDNVDRTLDAVRNASNDAEYEAAVGALQRVIQQDPPAIFLAWDQTTRAVSNRFIVAPPEPGRPDILSTLRLWKPVTDERHSSRN